jgi:hypothetical protein
MSVLEIVLLAIAGELGLGVALGKLLRGPRPQPVPVSLSRRAGLLNLEKSNVLIRR